MNIKIQTALLAIVVYGLTAALYAALLGGMYQHGYWGIDLFTLILAETALFCGSAGMIGYAKLSTQTIARSYVVQQAGIVLAVLSVLHTVACIVVPLNIELPYWIIFGIAVIWLSVRMYFVHTGASLQEQVESRQQVMHAQQQVVAQTLHVPTTLLVGAIQAVPAQQALKSSAADAVKAVSTLVDGFALKKLERNAALIGEVGRWNVRLTQMKASLADGDAAAVLSAIAEEARAEADLLNHLYLQ